MKKTILLICSICLLISCKKNPQSLSKITAKTIAIDSTPSDYSRIQIFVNGQLQNLGDGVTTTDCYFRDSGNTTTRGINEIVATDVLYWNGGIAGFRLTTNDTISISYEV